MTLVRDNSEQNEQDEASEHLDSKSWERRNDPRSLKNLCCCYEIFKTY